MTTKVAIIDYDVGNVRSILNALRKVGATPILTSDASEILNANKCILPGVGAFAKGMEYLNIKGLPKIIHQYVETGKPFMGICLGMQLMLDESEEFGITQGLGLVSGKVQRMPIKENTRLPHVSWNEILFPELRNIEDSILRSIPEKSDFYFSHSFQVVPVKSESILTTTVYEDVEFCSSIKNDNIYGLQFHPEKSAEIGLEVLSNFVAL